jgi:hypothetical protein
VAALGARKAELEVAIAAERTALAAAEAHAAAAAEAEAARKASGTRDVALDRALAAARDAAARYSAVCASTGWTVASLRAAPAVGCDLVVQYAHPTGAASRVVLHVVTGGAAAAAPAQITLQRAEYVAPAGAAAPAAWGAAGHITEYYTYAAQALQAAHAGTAGAAAPGLLRDLAAAFARAAALCREVSRLRASYSVGFVRGDGLSPAWHVALDVSLPAKRLKFRVLLDAGVAAGVAAYPLTALPFAVQWVAGAHARDSDVARIVQATEAAFVGSAAASGGAVADGMVGVLLAELTKEAASW